MAQYRKILKADGPGVWESLVTDQARHVPPPPLEKPCPAGAALIDLVAPEQLTLGTMPLIEAMRRRRSRRTYSEEPLTLEELSFLLWATQGVSQVVGGGAASLRTVPSGGARHPFETYLLVNRVETLSAGLYRYLPLEHQLYLVSAAEGLAAAIHAASDEQYVLPSAVTFIWTVVPYRAEWRYSIVAHRVIAMDAGHLCQNLYLACEAIGAGTCALGAYDQERMDAALGVDGEEEFTVYLAPVGKIR